MYSALNAVREFRRKVVRAVPCSLDLSCELTNGESAGAALVLFHTSLKLVLYQLERLEKGVFCGVNNCMICAGGGYLEMHFLCKGVGSPRLGGAIFFYSGSTLFLLISPAGQERKDWPQQNLKVPDNSIFFFFPSSLMHSRKNHSLS